MKGCTNKQINELHGTESLRSLQSFTYLRISRYFIEPEGSLPCAQEPATGPYPQPDESSPYYPILFLNIQLHIILLCLGLSSCLFPSEFPPKPYTPLFFSMRATWSAHLIHLDSIILSNL
jgi:hypothetical protein